jgi:hypothetical protein
LLLNILLRGFTFLGKIEDDLKILNIFLYLVVGGNPTFYFGNFFKLLLGLFRIIPKIGGL